MRHPCHYKRGHWTKAEADKAVIIAVLKYGVGFKSYKCPYCHTWHIAHSNKKDK